MGSGSFWNDDSTGQNNVQSRGLLASGWRPLSRQIDLSFLLHLATNDTWELTQKTLDLASDIADAIGRSRLYLVG